MNVRCIALRVSRTSGSTTADGSLTLGKTYLVLGILGNAQSLKYRIIPDGRLAPALFEAERFEVAHLSLPSDWSFRVSAGNVWTIEPRAWADQPLFWQRFYDGDTLAESCSKRRFRRFAVISRNSTI